MNQSFSVMAMFCFLVAITYDHWTYDKFVIGGIVSGSLYLIGVFIQVIKK